VQTALQGLLGAGCRWSGALQGMPDRARGSGEKLEGKNDSAGAAGKNARAV
jgi:hypothetical protein